FPQIVKDEKSSAKKEEKEVELDILGLDIDHRMIEIAKKNAKKAGVEQDILFKQMQLQDFHTDKEYGVLVSNPPYGERLGDRPQMKQLYREMGEILRPMDTWSRYILTSDLLFEEHVGMQATKKRKLYNGAIRTDYFQFWGKRRPRIQSERIEK
ncbi:MAG: methyltransferase domain-containing protein, partial [Streptococcaceae bacterium]|nr:methyltransferase domain-containing protein [Streptococcaceae bacterium]